MIYQIRYSAKENVLPVQLRFLGIEHLQEPINRPNGMPVFQWFCCTKGKGEFVVNNQKSVIMKGQGLLIYPSVPHSYRGLTDDWMMDFFAFDGMIVPELMKELGLIDSGVYNLAKPGIFEAYIKELECIFTSNSRFKKLDYSEKCYRFLVDLAQNTKRVIDSEYVYENELIRNMVFFMENHYDSAITLTEFSKRFGYSKEYLCACFKKSMNQTIMQYLQKIRISRARIFLLQYPEKPVCEIAAMCGFESPSYFGYIFKKEMGITPEQYRKE
ncbi:MAG: AraC family transcriptional regulator [Blautia sp.]|nr:AraC family transcriptional regulator [Blautia sp.]